MPPIIPMTGRSWPSASSDLTARRKSEGPRDLRTAATAFDDDLEGDEGADPKISLAGQASPC